MIQEKILQISNFCSDCNQILPVYVNSLKKATCSEISFRNPDIYVSLQTVVVLFQGRVPCNSISISADKLIFSLLVTNGEFEIWRKSNDYENE